VTTVTKQLITALLSALGVLAGLGFLASPAGVAAQEPPAQLGAQALNGPDFKISFGNNARNPEIAANNEFAALVYVQNGQVWLRSAQKGSGWGLTTLIATNGSIPKLAFRTGSTNTLYIVWVEPTAIRFRRCTLVDPTNVCINPISIASTSAANADQLRTPDIAVGGSQIFVTWVDRQTAASADNLIRLARSTNNGQNWTTGSQVSLAAGDDAGLPALAATTTHVHLAYKDNSLPWTIEYRRFLTTLGAPNASKTFFSGVDTNTNYQAMSHPAIAASGSNIYLLWDNDHDDFVGVYGLTGAQSTNSGATWVTPVRHIASQALATSDNEGDQKLSKDSGPPEEEAALLPSVTISTTTTFAAVWQQRPQENCQDPGGNPLNDTSEIYFTPNANVTNPAGWGTLANSRTDYALDPDVGVDTNGTHVAFMKDDSIPNCGTGGLAGEYGIFYRGPFTTESDKINRVLLPILLKVN
jgi:hypothetical protein